jgi:hypothetical protein
MKDRHGARRRACPKTVIRSAALFPPRHETAPTARKRWKTTVDKNAKVSGRSCFMQSNIVRLFLFMHQQVYV